jgi:hypothetical protein
MTISEREAHELLRPLEALPAIEARKRELRRKRRRHPIRLAAVIGAIGILGAGSAVAAIEKLSGVDEAKRERQMVKEHQELNGLSEASDQEIFREVEEHSGGSILPSEVDPVETRRSAQEELSIHFPDELRFYDAQHGLVHVTKCSWPHPNPDCVDPIEAIRNYPSAKIVETWSNGQPIAGGS